MKVRAFSLFLAICLLFSLAGCRKQGLEINPDGTTHEETPKVEVLTGVYRGTELNLPDDEPMDTSAMVKNAPKIDPETGDVTFWTADEDGQGHFLTVNTDGGVKSDIPFPVPEGHRIYGCVADGESLVYLTAAYVDRQQEDALLHRYDPAAGEERTGGELRRHFATADRQDGEPGGFGITSMTLDSDGDIWLGSSEEILVLSPDFVYKTSFVSTHYYMPLCASPDGSVWVPANDGVRILDKSTGQESALRFGDRPSMIAFGEGYDFYYATDDGVFGRNSEGSTLLMNYQSSSVTAGDSVFWGVFDAETFLFAESNGKIMIYTAIGDIDLSTVPTIEIATSSHWVSMMHYAKQIVEYNKTHPETHVVLTDYAQYNTDENPNGGTQKLTTDLLTGKIKPDIVIAAPRSYFEPEEGAEIEQMLKNKLYQDLTPFLESDPVLNPENLFGAVRR